MYKRQVVPTPVLVRSSSSSECGVMPLMMCARNTPESSAWMHDFSFGIMPVDTMLFSTMYCASNSVRFEMSESLFSKFSYRPSTSVRNTTLCAPMAAAIWPATMSAFTL